MGIPLQEQLLLNALGQNGKDSHGFLAQALFNEGVLLFPAGQGVEGSGLLTGQQLVDLGDEHGELGNEFHNALGNDGHAEVHALGGSGGNGVSNHVGNRGQGHLLGGNLFTDEADVGLGLQGALQGHMGGGTAHDLDEVPVFLGGVGIPLDVADELAVGLGGGIKAEGALDVFVLQVAVDGLGAADDLNTGVVGGHVLRQDSGVGIGVVTADDDNGGNAVLLANLGSDGELLFGFQLGAAGADDIEAAGVAEHVDVFIIHDAVVIFQQTAGAALEAIQLIFGIGGLQGVVQAADNVMAAGGLAAGEDHTHHLLFGSGGVGALLEGDLVLAVGIGEQCLDLFLVGHALGGLADLHTDFRNAVSQHTGQLRGVLISGSLQRRQIHSYQTPCVKKLCKNRCFSPMIIRYPFEKVNWYSDKKPGKTMKKSVRCRPRPWVS